jgi:hypothetical protein
LQARTTGSRMALLEGLDRAPGCRHGSGCDGTITAQATISSMTSGEGM